MAEVSPEGSTRILQPKSPAFYKIGIKKLPRRWKKCVAEKGDHFIVSLIGVALGWPSKYLWDKCFVFGQMVIWALDVI